MGQSASVGVERHLGEPLSTGQIDDLGGVAFADDVVGLQIAVRPSGSVQRGELAGPTGRQGEHVPSGRGAVVASVGGFEVSPQAGAVNSAQSQPGAFVVPAVVPVELGAEQAEDLSFTSRHETVCDLQCDVVDLVEGGATPVVQEFGVMVGQAEAGDDAVNR